MLSPSLEVLHQLGKGLGNSELDEKCFEDTSILDPVILTPHNSKLPPRVSKLLWKEPFLG